MRLSIHHTTHMQLADLEASLYESRGVAKKEKGLANAKQVPVHLMAFGRS